MRTARERTHKLAGDHVELALRELDVAEQRAGLGERLCQASTVTAAASSVVCAASAKGVAT
jgi:hypothetical protein